MKFNLPPTLDANLLEDLEGSCVAGGIDGMPFPTDTYVEAGQLILQRSSVESGALHAPYAIQDAGQFMTATGTLMDRPQPYSLPLELARGKLNQLRGQISDWISGGLDMPPEVRQLFHETQRAFVRAVSTWPVEDATLHADDTLKLASATGRGLVNAYRRQVFHVRHQRQQKLDTLLGCHWNRMPASEPEKKLASETFNTAVLRFPWKVIEPKPGAWNWEVSDQLVDWANKQGLIRIGGPLIDFSGRDFPDWYWEKELDLYSLGSSLCQFVGQVVRRYQKSIGLWQISAAANLAGVLARNDDELIWLNLRLAEAVRSVNPQFEVVVGLAQPWGEYLIQQARTESPFRFADKLHRTGMKLGALDLEIHMGICPRGTYCRDILDFSRLLDLYALLGTPLQLTMTYPSKLGRCSNADPEQRACNGFWKEGFSNETQADWADEFLSLAICKPYVRAVHWGEWSDAAIHYFPYCGLFDGQSQPKPILASLRRLRTEHLR